MRRFKPIFTLQDDQEKHPGGIRSHSIEALKVNTKGLCRKVFLRFASEQLAGLADFLLLSQTAKEGPRALQPFSEQSREVAPPQHH